MDIALAAPVRGDAAASLPSDFNWPCNVSMREQWRMPGNGLRIGVVRRVLEHLLLHLGRSTAS